MAGLPDLGALGEGGAAEGYAQALQALLDVLDGLRGLATIAALPAIDPEAVADAARRASDSATTRACSASSTARLAPMPLTSRVFWLAMRCRRVFSLLLLEADTWSMYSTQCLEEFQGELLVTMT
jgi:hypothetical protein